MIFVVITVIIKEGLLLQIQHSEQFFLAFYSLNLQGK